MTSINICKNAKKKVIEKIHQEHLEQFSRLRDYKDAIILKVFAIFYSQFVYLYAVSLIFSCIPFNLLTGFFFFC